jgi:hypothetical protein
MPADNRKAPEGWTSGGYLSQLPAGAQALVDQEKDRMGRLLAAVLVDKQVTLADLIIVVIADIEGEMGQALAGMLMDVDDVREELRAAQESGRRPVVLDVAVRDRATEFMSLVMPEIASYVAMRPPFAFVLLVIDREDNPSVTMAVPTTSAVAPGAVH